MEHEFELLCQKIGFISKEQPKEDNPWLHFTWLQEIITCQLFQHPCAVASLQAICAETIYLNLFTWDIALCNLLFFTFNCFPNQYLSVHVTQKMVIRLAHSEDVKSLPLPMNLQYYLHFNLIKLLDLFHAHFIYGGNPVEYFRAFLKRRWNKIK